MKETEYTVTVENSPWEGDGTYKGMLELTGFFLLQLKSYRSPNKSKKEREFLEADIRGYEELLNAGNRKNADKFYELKHDRKEKGIPFKNNEEIVKYMKRCEIWETERDE